MEGGPVQPPSRYIEGLARPAEISAESEKRKGAVLVQDLGKDHGDELAFQAHINSYTLQIRGTEVFQELPDIRVPRSALDQFGFLSYRLLCRTLDMQDNYHAAIFSAQDHLGCKNPFILRMLEVGLRGYLHSLYRKQINSACREWERNVQRLNDCERQLLCFQSAAGFPVSDSVDPQGMSAWRHQIMSMNFVSTVWDSERHDRVKERATLERELVLVAKKAVQLTRLRPPSNCPSSPARQSAMQRQMCVAAVERIVKLGEPARNPDRVGLYDLAEIMWRFCFLCSRRYNGNMDPHDLFSGVAAEMIQRRDSKPWTPSALEDLSTWADTWCGSMEPQLRG